MSDDDVVATFVRPPGSGSRSDLQEQSATDGCAVAVCTYGRSSSVSRLIDSLIEQLPGPDQVVIIDASPDAATEQMLRARTDLDCLAKSLVYVRVQGRLRGSARQRNFALQFVTSDLVTFLDDDVVLLPGCLGEMEKMHRRGPADIVGVAACLQNQLLEPTTLARVWLRLRMVSSLRPGSYSRSGINVPWEFLPPTREFVEGEWLYTTAAMWKTAVARQVQFCDAFTGYSLGEDLEFSLRARRYGRVGVAGGARVIHLHEGASRPDPFTLGYMEIFNRHLIHQRTLVNRSRRDAWWFAYAWILDTLLLTRDLRFPSRGNATLRRLCGRFKGAYDVLTGSGASAAC